MMNRRLFFPQRLLGIAALQWQIRETSRSGGPSILGSEQIVSSPSGRWYASMTLAIGAMAWNGSEELLIYRGFMARLRGRARVVDLPLFDGRGPGQLANLALQSRHGDQRAFRDGTRYRQGSVPALLAADAAMNAVELQLSMPTGQQPRLGQCLTLPGGWMHQISDLVARDGAIWTVVVSPWLRQDYAAGTKAEVDRPTARMRLASDDSGGLQIRAAEGWASPTVEFVEAF